jgi:hypothetical protein
MRRSTVQSLPSLSARVPWIIVRCFSEFVLFSDLLVSVAADVATVEATLETARRKFRSVELKIRDGRSKLTHKKIIREKTHYLNVQVSTS